jgi:hypothetical protein
MRTKTLLLTAALSAAGLLPSTAQVFSVNAVGYVNQTVPAGKQAILTNPLNGTDNKINTILPLPNNAGFAGNAVFRYDSDGFTFRDALEWFDDFGWYSPTEDNPAINPGEGFFFRNVAAAPVNLTFVGEVPSGTVPNQIPSGNKLAFRGSQIPWAKPLGDTTINAAGSMTFPAVAGDAVFIWNVAGNGYNDPFEYFDGFGWFAATGDQGPGGPAIQVGTGFALRTVAGAPARTWNQSFTVN